MDRLDIYEDLPTAMREYLSQYGWHFSQKLCEKAVEKMRDRNDKKITPYTKEQLEQMKKQYNVQLTNDKGYDALYVANMCKADYLGSSITSEQNVMLYVKDFIDDKDGQETKALDHYYADCLAKGIPLLWEQYM